MTSTVIKTEPDAIKTANQICRLCLSKESLVDLFQENALHQWVSDFLSITVSTEDRISKAICASCRQRLTEFHHFRMRSQEVQCVLQSMVQNEMVEVEREPPRAKTHGCKRCGKSFAERQHLEKHMKTHTKLLNAGENKSKSSETQCTVAELREVKTEPCEQDDLTIRTQEHGKSKSNSRASQESPNHGNSGLQEIILHLGSDFPRSDTQGHEGETRTRFVYEDVECVQSIGIEEINIDEVKVEKLPKTNATVSKSTQTDHAAGDASKVAAFQCNVCYKSVQSGRALWSHYRTVHGPKEHMCHICETSYPYLKDLKKHEITNKHKLKLKEVQANRKRSKTTQNQQENDTDSDRSIIEQNTLDNNDNEQSSSKCIQKSIREHQLAKPMETDETIEEQPIEMDHEKYEVTAETDPDYSPSTSTADRTIPVKEGPEGDEQLQCDICHELFANEMKLMLHKKYHGSRGHACPKCGKSFLNRFVLQEHISSHESQAPERKRRRPVTKAGSSNAAKPYKCNICQKVFKLQSCLRNHRNQYHDPKTRVCHICGCKFVTGFDLAMHMKIHYPDGEEDVDPLQQM